MNALARVEPPSNARQRLLQAARNADQPTGSRFGYLLALIDTEQSTVTQDLIPWVVSSRVQAGILARFIL
jgi:hypothetical protein